MDIERKALIQNLEQFAVDGNGIVTGKPGVGKTHSLLELVKLFKKKGIPHLVLPIDQLGEGTDEELRNLLSFKGDLILKLREEIEQLKITPGIILFDAFDAARNEEIRERFVSLIKRIIYDLKGLWNVIVTVRTYDASKSEKLLKLFGESSPNAQTPYQHKEIECRHFMIPLLNENEVKQAVEQIPGLAAIYGYASADFKDLLNIPFNLWLIERILKDSKTVPDMSRVKSEVQLLGLFWGERVRNRDDGEEREDILTRLVGNMMAEHSLSSRKEKVYRIAEKEIWKTLLSDEIIIEISSSKRRVSFSHNILFDYAVSILMIDDEYRELKNFILEEPSRPVFLRPSLDYYFTRLWIDNASTFWEIYRDILLDGDQNLRPFTRLIPPLVIAREAGEVQEFDLLAELFEKKEDAANKGMLHILQAHKALQITKDLLWIQVLDMVSEYMNQEFAWDMTQLASNIFDRAKSASNDDIIKICGQVGRCILSWVWQKRKENKEWFDRLGAIWAVPLVAKTFKTDVPASGKLIEEIFNIAEKEKFPIKYFFNLTHHIEAILPHDLEIVSKIYKIIFEYKEVSQERTVFGSAIVQMSSTRQQDFQLCQYGLKKHFPAFLKKAPLVAVETALQFLTKHILRNHVAGYLKEGVEFEDLLEKFNFREKVAFFISDNSAIWDIGNRRMESPIEIADAIFKFLAELAESGKNHNLLESLLDVFRDNSVLAFFWKRLLGTGAKVPKIFAPLLFEMCIAKPIQVESSTIHQLGVFLEKASENFSEVQLEQIEKSILKIPKGETDKERLGYLEGKRNRLLACIPEGMLTTSEARELIGTLKEADQIPKNEPLFSMQTSFNRELIDEDWLKYQGVEIQNEKNQKLMKYFDPLNNFGVQWKEDSTDNESKEKLLKIIQDVFQYLKNGPMADQKLINTLWTKLASAAETMSKGELAPESREFQFCREVLLKCSEHEEPIYREDSEKEFAKLPGWSPAPRIEAVQGLVNLAAIKPDKEILSAIEKLTFDKVPAVRYQVAPHLYKMYEKSKEYFWRLVEKFAKNEKNITIQDALCMTLWNVARYDEDRTIRILEMVLSLSLDQEVKDISHDSRIFLLVWLFLTRGNQWAINKINNILEKKETHLSVLKTLVGEISKYLTPEGIETRKDGVEMAVDVLKRIMDTSLENITKYKEISEDELDEKQKEKITDSYEVLDDIISRLYFHSDKSEVNQENQASDKQLKIYYFMAKPLLEKIVSSVSPKGKLFLTAHMAHYFMQLLNNVLKFDPKVALHMAAEIALSSKPSGYNLDSLAVQEVVKIVETTLADHRNEVKEESSLKDLLSLLDIFAETGWPEAIQLTWRLDEIFR